jgi:hypothetical protein
VWRKQVNKAANLDYAGLASGTEGDGPGSFAYSPLPATEYENADDSTYPGPGSATFTGETVALQPSGAAGGVIYTGVITVTASWDGTWTGFVREEDGTIPHNTSTIGDARAAEITAPATGTNPTDYKLGTITAVITGLETADGDPLEYVVSAMVAGDDPGTTVDETENGTETHQYVRETKMGIRDVIFANVYITTSFKDDENELMVMTDFTAPAGAGETGATNLGPRARIVTMVGNNPITVVGFGQPENTTSTASLVGTFVGQDVDGPLGVLGRWTLMDPDDVTITPVPIDRTGPTDTTKASEIRRTTVQIDDAIRIGTGQTLYGAFGAEVEP